LKDDARAARTGSSAAALSDADGEAGGAGILVRSSMLFDQLSVEWAPGR